MVYLLKLDQIPAKFIHFGIAGVTFLAVAGTVTTAIAQDRTVWLDSGDVASYNGYFRAGESIYGGCDGDCQNLDISIYDGDTLLVEDNQPDKEPMVVVPSDGDFTVKLTMDQCSHSSGCQAWVSSDDGF